jgi:hypothetical protein
MIAGGVLAVSIGVATWLGVAAQSWPRYQTLLDLRTYLEDGRVKNWQAAMRAVKDHWWVGTGYGSYRYAYGPYESESASQWLLHAENIFVEVLLEGGVVGLLLLVLGTVFLASCCWQLLNTPGTKPDWYIGVGGLYILITQASQNCMDHGLYQPANLFTFSIVAGLTVGAWQHRREPPQRTTARDWPPFRRFFRFFNSQRWAYCTFAILLILILSGVWNSSRYAPVETLVREVQRVREKRQSPRDEELRRWREGLAAALLRYPNSAEGWLTLAELYIEEFGRQAGNYSWPLARHPVTDVGRLETLFAVVASSGDNRSQTVQSLRDWPPIAQWLQPAHQALLAARRSCPLVAKVHLRLAYLWFVGAPSDSNCGEHLERAVRCAPTHTAILLPAAMAYAAMGDRNRALELIHNLERLDPQLAQRLAHYFARLATDSLQRARGTPP